MSRTTPWVCVVCLSVAPAFARAQDIPLKNVPPATVALFEDDAEEFKKNLHNPGAEDASVADRSDEAFYAGTCSLTVSEFQRFNPLMPGWSFKIAEKPQPGEFRYLRFAWKRTEAPGIMLQLHAPPNAWHRYYAGSISKRTQEWGAMTQIDEAVPRQWKMVTRDLFADHGAMTITGIGLSALEGPGYAYFDHIHLGRTIEDLDRVTAELIGIAEPPATVPNEGSRWLIRGLAIAGILIALAVCLFAWLRKRAATQKNAESRHR